MCAAPTADAREALARLVSAEDQVAALADRHGLDLIVVFGSVLHSERPNDLDLGVDHRGGLDVLAVLEDLYQTTGLERVDVLDLHRAGIVARAEALGHGRLLWEREPGEFAEAQVVALALLWDTRWLRDLELEMLARLAPGPLRPEAVQRRLAEVRTLLGVLERHRGVTADRLETDVERRLMIERALCQIVDLAVKINTHVVTSSGAMPPSDYHGSFAAAAQAELLSDELANVLAPSAGLRNRLVHEYEVIDLSFVAAAIGPAIEDYGRYVREAAAFLQRQADEPKEPCG